MPAPLLPIDILPEILHHFVGELDEPASLFKVLFVNRTWCRTVLPLLWSNPFLLCQQPENRIKLITTFVGCLSDQDKKFIIDRGIGIQIPKERPTMDYPLYITHVEEKNVIEAVQCWYQQSQQSEENKYEVTVIAAILFKMFIERSKHIKWLNLDCDQINAKWYNGEITHQPYMADKILESLTKYQHSLQRIAVVFSSNGSPADFAHLSKLVSECIKVQGRFLRDFVVENANGEGFSEMTYALRPRANSLRRVGYTQCDFAKFPWQVGIEILSQVNELYFIACTNLRDEYLRNLEPRMEKPFPEFYYYILKGLEP